MRAGVAVSLAVLVCASAASAAPSVSRLQALAGKLRSRRSAVVVKTAGKASARSRQVSRAAALRSVYRQLASLEYRACLSSRIPASSRTQVASALRGLALAGEPAAEGRLLADGSGACGCPSGSEELGADAYGLCYCALAAKPDALDARLEKRLSKLDKVAAAGTMRLAGRKVAANPKAGVSARVSGRFLRAQAYERMASVLTRPAFAPTPLGPDGKPDLDRVPTSTSLSKLVSVLRAGEGPVFVARPVAGRYRTARVPRAQALKRAYRLMAALDYRASLIAGLPKSQARAAAAALENLRAAPPASSRKSSRFADDEGNDDSGGDPASEPDPSYDGAADTSGADEVPAQDWQVHLETPQWQEQPSDDSGDASSSLPPAPDAAVDAAPSDPLDGTALADSADQDPAPDLSSTWADATGEDDQGQAAPPDDPGDVAVPLTPFDWSTPQLTDEEAKGCLTDELCGVASTEVPDVPAPQPEVAPADEAQAAPAPDEASPAPAQPEVAETDDSPPQDADGPSDDSLLVPEEPSATEAGASAPSGDGTPPPAPQPTLAPAAQAAGPGRCLAAEDGAGKCWTLPTGFARKARKARRVADRATDAYWNKLVSDTLTYAITETMRQNGFFGKPAKACPAASVAVHSGRAFAICAAHRAVSGRPAGKASRPAFLSRLAKLGARAHAASSKLSSATTRSRKASLLLARAQLYQRMAALIPEAAPAASPEDQIKKDEQDLEDMEKEMRQRVETGGGQ